MTIKLCFIAPANSIHTERWVRAFSQIENFQVTLISPYGAPHNESDFGRARLIWMSPPLLSQHPKTRWKIAFKNFFTMRQYILHNKFDIVHVHQLPPPLTVPFFWKIPNMVVSTWGADIIDTDVHPGTWIKRWARRFILSQASVITATSRFLAERTKRFTKGNKTVNVVSFGVDLSQFYDPVQRPPYPPVKFIITKGLTPQYGVDILIRAMGVVRDQYQNVELMIVGDGNLREKLEALSRNLGLETIVHFLGYVSHQKIPGLLHEAHIAVMPSTNHAESFGVAALEAQATGIPVVASRVGGIPEVVIDGETGLLVQPRNVQSLAEALLYLALHHEKRLQMGHAGREFVRQHYNWNLSVEKMKEVYQMLL